MSRSRATPSAPTSPPPPATPATASKLAPILGELIADAVLGRANRFVLRFRWRTDLAGSFRGDAARSS